VRNLVIQRKWILVLVLLPVLSSTLAATVQVSASVDARSVLVQQPFKLTVEARDTESMPVVRMPDIDRLAVISGPMQSSNYSWVNGKMSGFKSVTYTLVALTPGDLVIPALDVRVDKQVVKTEPIRLRVVQRGQQTDPAQGGAAQETASIFIRAIPSKDEVYLGEPVSVRFKLYTQVSVFNYQIDKFPDAVGFWAEEIEQVRQPRLVSEILDGVRYNTAVLKTVVFYPTRSGELEIDALRAQLEVEVKSNNRRRGLFNDPFFNDPLLDPFARRVQRNFLSNPLTIQVKPLPEPVPRNYGGAVGTFSLNAKLDTSVLQVNDAVGLHLTLKGKGNFKTLQVPDPDLPEEIDAFKPERSEAIKLVDNQYTGYKQATYLLVPRQPGEYFIESLDFSYFDPRAGNYRQIRTAPLRLQVVQAGKDEQVIVSGYSREEVEMMGEDIRYIKAAGSGFLRMGGTHRGAATLWVSFALGVIAVAASFFWEYHRSRLDQNLALKRRNRALRQAKRILRSAGGLAEGSEQFSAWVNQALLGFIGDRLDLAEHALETRDLLDIVEGRLKDEDLFQELRNLMQILSMDRFAPGYESRSQKELLEKADAVINRLNRELRF